MLRNLKEVNSLAIFSFILGILSLVLMIAMFVLEEYWDTVMFIFSPLFGFTAIILGTIIFVY
jgi:hypothetical protein